MTEILTESFCERCGTRYTFEIRASARAPQGRQGPLARPQELRHVGRQFDRRGDGRGPQRHRPRADRPPARCLPQDVQLLHVVPAVHLPELLERSRGTLPVLCPVLGSGGHAGPVPGSRHKLLPGRGSGRHGCHQWVERARLGRRGRSGPGRGRRRRGSQFGRGRRQFRGPSPGTDGSAGREPGRARRRDRGRREGRRRGHRGRPGRDAGRRGRVGRCRNGVPRALGRDRRGASGRAGR